MEKRISSFVIPNYSLTITIYYQATSTARAMQSFREKLPAYKMKEEFLRAVAENQV